MAKWHTNLKRQKHFDKNILSHNRVHFSLKILQKTSDFHFFMEACWTLDCRKGPETEIFHPGLVNLPSNFRKMAAFNWLPDFRSNAPLVLFMISMLSIWSQCVVTSFCFHNWLMLPLLRCMDRIRKIYLFFFYAWIVWETSNGSEFSCAILIRTLQFANKRRPMDNFKFKQYVF